MHDPFRITDFAYAHRGLWNADRPENSASAFKAAAAHGLGAECDVHLTADGEVVVHHDFTLQRMFGDTRALRDVALDDLRSITFSRPHETIPTLTEIVDVMGDLPLLIELKVDDTTDRQALADAVWKVFRGRITKVGIMSFDTAILKHFMDPARTFKLGLLTTPLALQTDESIAQTRRTLIDLTADFYAPHVVDCGPARAHICKHGQALITWTVSQPEHLQFARAANAAPIFEKLDPDLVTAINPPT
ncbi:MAG: hypothetical protein CMK09_14410 [Ponticaulis sp.]|nr:hypothetical protein [Ponticaulis sp.]|tara:strand:- start:43025 stop:43765 length:741 start_codon:yes stop_codon:yes gene_type:complete